MAPPPVLQGTTDLRPLASDRRMETRAVGPDVIDRMLLGGPGYLVRRGSGDRDSTVYFRLLHNQEGPRARP